MTSSGAEPMPNAARKGVDLRRLRLADHAVAAGTVLYLIALLAPWYRVDGFDLGSGYRMPDVSVNGFDSGMLTVAFVLLVLASVWALLPAFADVPVPFPRAVLTAGLTALAFVLTLTEWLATFDTGFTLMGLLAFLSSAAVLAVAALRMLPELRAGGAVPGHPADAAPWADRPAPQFEGGGVAGRGTADPPPGPPSAGGPAAGPVAGA
jgi:hypothetical protein